MVISAGTYNADYLAIKKEKLGHLFDTKNIKEIGRCYVIYWQGSVSSQTLSLYKNQAEYKAQDLNLDIRPENSSRLLALWERPKFVWRIVNIKHLNSIVLLLKFISKWEGTKRIGLFVCKNNEQINHPSQNLLNETLDIIQLDKLDIETIIKGGFPKVFNWS